MLTSWQYAWTSLCTIAPALIIGFQRSWWRGLLAYAICLLLNGIIGWVAVFTLDLSGGRGALFGYLKNAAVGLLVLTVGLAL
jgi:hypothetical protein